MSPLQKDIDYAAEKVKAWVEYADERKEYPDERLNDKLNIMIGLLSKIVLYLGRNEKRAHALNEFFHELDTSPEEILNEDRKAGEIVYTSKVAKKSKRKTKKKTTKKRTKKKTTQRRKKK